MQIPAGMLIFFTLVLGFGGSRTPINACQVLSARDVAAVQGARFKSTKLRESGNREMQVSSFVTNPFSQLNKGSSGPVSAPSRPASSCSSRGSS